jgi:hypothetical protein
MLYDPKWDEELPVNLDKPTLEGLIYLLRHPDLWPVGFSWFYPDCMRCAMGLSYFMWKNSGISHPILGTSQTVGRHFDLDEYQSKNAFLGATWRLHKFPLTKVTPEMVADLLESYLDLKRSDTEVLESAT